MFLEVHLLLLLEWKPVHVSFLYHKSSDAVSSVCTCGHVCPNYHKVRGVEVSVTPSLDLVHWEHTARYTGSAHHIMDVHNTHMKNSQSLASLNPLHNKVQFFPEHDTLV